MQKDLKASKKTLWVGSDVELTDLVGGRLTRNCPTDATKS